MELNLPEMALTFTLELESSSSASGGDFGGVGDVVDYSHSQSHGRRERMFEKVVTPSDVGKLNRLVVPKQFAERHLPLRGAAARARGTVLCFHDGRGGGASWRFRYSYWSSSQSYVMTKGWNRYVRDKRLAAGDTVTFCRDGARLFIDCRRRKTRSGEGAVVPASAVVPAPAIVSVPPTCQKLQGLVVPAPAIVAVPPTCQQLQGLVVPAPAIVGVPPTCQQQQGLVVFPGHGQHKQQHQQADEVVAAVVEAAAETEEARRWLRLFGVNLLELRAEPVLLDLLL